MKVYVTGAAGLIGWSAYRALTGLGWRVQGCDWRMPSRKMENVSEIDLRRPLPADFFKGYEVIVHLAGHSKIGSVPDRELFADNTAIDENVFGAAVTSGVHKIIFSSSAQVFTGRESYAPDFRPGLPLYLPLDEKLPANARNGYARSKLLAEQSLEVISERHAIAAVVLRLPWVLPLKQFFHATKRTVAISTKAEGFSFLMLDDAISLVVAACEQKTLGYHCYFPAAHENLLWITAEAARAQYLSAVPINPEFEKLESLVDLTALRRELHWQPRRIDKWAGVVVRARNFLSRVRQHLRA